MSIGTAKPSKEEMAEVPHYFIDSHSIHAPLTAGQYEIEALKVLNDLFLSNENVVLVGGTGLYIDAVIKGLDDFPDVDPLVEKEVEKELNAGRLQELLNELADRDPQYYKEVDKSNGRRVGRAIKVIRSSGQPFSTFLSKNSKTRNFDVKGHVLQMDRETLYDRINQRVDLMLEAGLLQEAENLLPFKHLKPLQTVGYQELFDYFEGKTQLEEAIHLIKRNSRRYAKRQMTWFRRYPDWEVVNQ